MTPDMNDIEHRIYNVTRAIEIAWNLEMYGSESENGRDLVTYSLDNAYREAKELREAFRHGQKPA
jgi:hypothetical protein